MSNNWLLCYIGSEKEVTIPSGITDIGPYAFYKNNAIEKVVVPQGIEHIAAEAFAYCNNLKEVSLPDSLNKIEYCAFCYCIQLSSISIPDGIETIAVETFRGCTELKEIWIPASLLHIEGCAFAYCSKLAAVHYGGSELARSHITGLDDSNRELADALWKYNSTYVDEPIQSCGQKIIWSLDSEGVLTLTGDGSTYCYKSKGSPWYSYHSAIKKIIIGDGISELQSYLFEDLDNLTSVSIPESVTGVLPYTFVNCTKLQTVYLPSNLFGYPMGPVFYKCSQLTVYLKSSAYCVIPSLRSDNISFVVTDATSDFIVFNNWLLGYIGSEKEVTIPNGITDIGPYVFYKDDVIEKVVIPQGVDSIATGAFAYCYNLKEVSLPDRLSRIDDCAFCYCTRLTSICIPDGIKSIAVETFRGCTGLKEIWIPASLLHIEGCAFAYCSNLAIVHYGGDKSSKSNIWGLDDSNQPITDAFWCYFDDHVLHLPSGLSIIEPYALANNRADIIVVPVGVMEIGDHAFSSNTNLRAVIFEGNPSVLDPDILSEGNGAIIICYGGGIVEDWATRQGYQVILIGK